MNRKKMQIKSNFRHTFSINLFETFTPKGATRLGLYGFHHDHHGALERKKLMHFIKKEIRRNGEYKAKVYLNNKQIGHKNFFPQVWSPQITVQKIMAAIRNPIQKVILEGTRIIIRGVTDEKEKIVIQIIVDTKTETLLSAYPILAKEYK